MEEYQYSTEEEIFLHKKRLLENSTLKKYSKIYVLLSFISLSLLLFSSLFTIRDSWICSLDYFFNQYNSVCQELRKSVNCRTTLASPIKAEVFLRINNSKLISSVAFCGWDTAVSEIRICFLILSFVSIYIAIKAFNISSPQLCNIFSYCSMFFAILLVITSCFDYIQILDSQNDNYNMCNMRDQFKVRDTYTSEQVNCSYGVFYTTILFSLLSAVLLLISSCFIDKWAKSIPQDDY